VPELALVSEPVSALVSALESVPELVPVLALRELAQQLHQV
jgi:hypothetical protein